MAHLRTLWSPSRIFPMRAHPVRIPLTAVLRRFLLLPLVAMSACSSGTEPDPGPGTLIDVARSAGTFGTLLAAAEAAGLTATLASGGPYTVFAPEDGAFAGYPQEIIQGLLANRELLTRVLSYHVVPGIFRASDLVGRTSLPTVNGTPLEISAQGTALRINSATVTRADLVASNGVVHGINVLLLPEPILDLVQSAGGFPVLRTFVSLVQTAALTTTLKGPGPFTVLAPRDEAFAALPPGVLSALQQDPAALAAVLRLHVIPGIIPFAAMQSRTSVTTVTGAVLPVTVGPDGTTRVGGVRIVNTDLKATNGILHMLDGVIQSAP